MESFGWMCCFVKLLHLFNLSCLMELVKRLSLWTAGREVGLAESSPWIRFLDHTASRKNNYFYAFLELLTLGYSRSKFEFRLSV